VPTAVGRELVLEPVVEQRVGVRAGGNEDRAAVTTVPTARPPAWNAFLAPGRQASAAAVTGRNVDIDLVNEHQSLGSRARSGSGAAIRLAER